jgi:hypothetical protein
MARAIKLINAPVGLFDIDGVLVLKTEYSTQHEDGAITPDCYIVDSGEYFWGGVDSVEERNNLMVTPIDMPTLTPPDEPLTPEQLREMDGEPVWVEQQAAWGLVEVHKNRVYIIGLDFESGYSLHWNIYRRPPEGEADA